MGYEIEQEGIKKVQALMNELKINCAIYKIPMFATCVLKEDNENTEYYSVVFSPGANRISLNDDKIRKHILVQNGFRVVPGREYHEITMDDIEKLREGDPSA